MSLGTQNNVISQNTGEGGTINLDEATIGGIQNRRVKVVNGKIQITDETGPNTFVAPFAVASKPKYEMQDKTHWDPSTNKEVATIDPETGKPEQTLGKTDQVEDVFVPLSQVANVKSTDDNSVIIDKSYQEALDANKSDANKEANDEFQKYFGMTKVDIEKNRKTGVKSTSTSTTNKGYIYK